MSGEDAMTTALFGRLAECHRHGDHTAAVRLLQHGRGPGEALSAGLRERLAGHLGADLARVRVHTDGFAARAAAALGANAFTVGDDVFFGRGRWAPDRPGGLRLLAHELAHTLQQRGAGVPTDEQIGRLEVQAERLARFGAAAVPDLDQVGPAVLREPTFPRRTTGDNMLREVGRVLTLAGDVNSTDPVQKLWSAVASNFPAVATAGSLARKVWTYLFLRHFVERDSRPGVESAHPRYFYSHAYGWVDGQHFFGFIDFAEQKYKAAGGDRKKAFDASTGQGLEIEQRQQTIRDLVVLKRPDPTDKTQLFQVHPPNTPLFRLPHATADSATRGAAEAAAAFLLSGTQGELFALLDPTQRKKFFDDCAKSAFTYEDFRSNQLGTRYFFRHGININAQPPAARETQFRAALQTFFAGINVENDQKRLDKLASGLPMQEQFSAGKTTEDAERQAHPDLFTLP
jgi:hypothetical protein